MTTRLIGLADDYPVIIDALAGKLAQAGGFGVAFQARTGEQLLQALKDKPCELLVTDYSMKQGTLGGDGLAMVERVLRQCPGLKVVVFTMLSNRALFSQLTKLGVHGIVSKNDQMSEVLAAIRAIDANSAPPYCSPSVREQVAMPAVGNAPLQRLSPSEREVARLFAEGKTLDEIAAHLHRAKSTIATHKQNAMQKLGIANNADLICYAYEVGIV
ncbi:response regulator transcription factor [Trinickia terrae]|uniref:Response regulator transcription factor n=1 Tax=Trinickia terrae TaxID=2571161 RepID=A0A4U1IBR4_9BURK|nr:response regulator transcription factor [Trinickia terrae]TKC91021.1 response regulator transcription factor [Trinickia terrae]